jgi:acetyl-CoA carboxylase carboxyltransferase component
LLDKGCEIQEIGAFAGHGMYEEYGGCPSGGVIVVIGMVSGGDVLLWQMMQL